MAELNEEKLNKLQELLNSSPIEYSSIWCDGVNDFQIEVDDKLDFKVLGNMMRAIEAIFGIEPKSSKGRLRDKRRGEYLIEVEGYHVMRD